MGKALMHKKVSFGFVASLLSIGIDGIAGLIILPLLLKFLNEEIVGLWLFFISFTGIVMMGQAGLSPVIVRLSAHIKTKQNKSKNNWTIITFSYLIATIFVLLICISIYFFYIINVLKEQNFIYEGSVCWIFLTISYMIRIFFMKNIHVINGFGEVGWDKALKIFSALINLGGFYLVLELGYGFKSLGLVYLLSGITFAILSYTLLKRFNNNYINTNYTKAKVREVIDLFKESGKILILNLSAFVILQSNLFIIERIIGLKILPYYNGLYRIASLIMMSCGVVSTMLYPYIAQAYSRNDLSKVKSLFYWNVLITDSIAIILSLILFFLAPILVPIWLGEGSYLGPKVFGLMLLLIIIYSNHKAFANAIIAIGANTFVYAAIINAALSIPFAYLGGIQFGIIGIIGGNLIATLLPSAYVVIWSQRFINKISITEMRH